MNKTLFTLLAASMLASTITPASAQSQPEVPVASVSQQSSLEAAIAQLQQEWAVIKYQTTYEEKQEQDIDALARKADDVVEHYPNMAEPLIWDGIIWATKAGINGGLTALSDAKTARAALEKAEQINPAALNGSVYTSLGSLYYKVPGFPIGFGDNDKAKQYLEKALAANPTGIDPNFFYGEFLYEEGDYANAQTALYKALQAPARPGRELADKGRAEEVRDLLVKIEKKKGG